MKRLLIAAAALTMFAAPAALAQHGGRGGHGGGHGGAQVSIGFGGGHGGGHVSRRPGGYGGYGYGYAPRYAGGYPTAVPYDYYRYQNRRGHHPRRSHRRVRHHGW